MEFPTAYQAISAALSFLNLNFSTASVLTCSADGSYDYFTRLMIDTVYPVMLVFLLILLNRIHVYCKADVQIEGTELANVNSKYYSVVIIFTSLILPGISGKTTLFQVNNV